MDFYLVKMRSFPQIEFACTVVTDKFKNVITHRRGMIEVSVASAGLIAQENGAEYELPPHTLHIILPDRDVRLHAASSEKMYQTTVAVRAEFDWRHITCEPEEVTGYLKEAKEDELVLPMYMPLDTWFYNDLEQRMRKIALLWSQKKMPQTYAAVSLWCEVLSRISRDYCDRVLGTEKQRQALYYSRKVQKYIQRHLTEDVTVQEMASALGITPNYLSRIFHEETGQKISAYRG